MTDQRSGQAAPTYTPEDLEREARLLFVGPYPQPKSVAELHAIQAMLRAGAAAMRDLVQARAKAGKKAAEARIAHLKANQRTPGTYEVCEKCNRADGECKIGKRIIESSWANCSNNPCPLKPKGDA